MPGTDHIIIVRDEHDHCLAGTCLGSVSSQSYARKLSEDGTRMVIDPEARTKRRQCPCLCGKCTAAKTLERETARIVLGS